MKTNSTKIIAHGTLGLIAAAGSIALVLAWRAPDGITVAVRSCYAAYGILFLVGSFAYYTKPRMGSVILIVSLLSSIVVAPLVGFPAWIDGSIGSRAGLILGVMTATGIVCGPLLKSRENREIA